MKKLTILFIFVLIILTSCTLSDLTSAVIASNLSSIIKDASTQIKNDSLSTTTYTYSDESPSAQSQIYTLYDGKMLIGKINLSSTKAKYFIKFDKFNYQNIKFNGLLTYVIDKTSNDIINSIKYNFIYSEDTKLKLEFTLIEEKGSERVKSTVEKGTINNENISSYFIAIIAGPIFSLNDSSQFPF